MFPVVVSHDRSNTFITATNTKSPAWLRRSWLYILPCGAFQDERPGGHHCSTLVLPHEQITSWSIERCGNEDSIPFDAFTFRSMFAEYFDQLSSNVRVRYL